MRGRIETIDVFRGLSILVVVLFHFTARVPPDSLNVSGYPLASRILGFGWRLFLFRDFGILHFPHP